MQKSKIKQRLLGALLVIILTAGSVLNAAAQNPQGKTRKPCQPKAGQMQMLDRLPGITDTQKQQITKLRTAMMKDIMPLQNAIGEKRAKLRTLATADKADMKAINSLIDEIAKLQASIQKRRMQFVQELRALLTDEQRVVFDSRMGKFFTKGGHRGAHGHGMKGCRR